MKDCAQPLQHIEHGIPPVFDERSEVLVLGTMPSPKSREAAFFYGHPQNRFWRVLAALFDEPVPEDNAERADLLLRHHIALWDVLESCDIRGASDASIANPHPNDLSRVLEKAPVRRVFCTGAAAGRYYAKLCEAASGLAAEVLPSPSPANAAWSLPRLVEAYRPVADATTPFKPPVLEVSQVVALERAIAEAGTPLDALMRRAAAPAVAADDEFSCGPIALTVSSHDVSVDGENVALTLKEFDLLRTLMQNEGHVLSRRQLLEDVWGMTYVGETRTVDVHIQTLRQKLAAAVEGADAYIQTVRGVGYCVKQP